MSQLRESKDDEIKDLKARAAENEQGHKKEIEELRKRKDAEIEALQQQSKVDLEQQKSMTLEVEEKCQNLEKQLSGGDAGMKDMQAKLEKVSVPPFTLAMFKQLTCPKDGIRVIGSKRS